MENKSNEWQWLEKRVTNSLNFIINVMHTMYRARVRFTLVKEFPMHGQRWNENIERVKCSVQNKGYRERESEKEMRTRANRAGERAKD